MHGKTHIPWFPTVEHLKKEIQKEIPICVIMIVTTIENANKDTDKSIRCNIYTIVICCLNCEFYYADECTNIGTF
jgi:hypothetical protein